MSSWQAAGANRELSGSVVTARTVVRHGSMYLPSTRRPRTKVQKAIRAVENRNAWARCRRNSTLCNGSDTRHFLCNTYSDVLATVKTGVVELKSPRVTVMEGWYCGAHGSTSAQHPDRRSGHLHTCQHGGLTMDKIGRCGGDGWARTSVQVQRTSRACSGLDETDQG